MKQKIISYRSFVQICECLGRNYTLEGATEIYHSDVVECDKLGNIVKIDKKVVVRDFNSLVYSLSD